MRIFICLLILSQLSLASPRLLKDINKNYPRLSTVHFTKSGSKLFFSRTTSDSGAELWVEESGSIRLVKDIVPGAEGSSPLYLRPATFSGNAGIYFIARTPELGYELWKSDGTEGGTTVVKDIAPGPASGIQISIFPPPMKGIEGTSFMWFAASDGTNGVEPWVTDGTSGGTTIVSNLNPGSASSNPREFFIIPSFFTLIMFSAETFAGGREPYVMVAGGAPSLVSDISAGAGSSNPYGFSFNGDSSKVLFAATTAANGIEPWQTNFTTTGIVKDINPGAEVAAYPFMVGLTTGNVFARISSGGTGLEAKIFNSDGTNGGTSELKTLDCLPAGPLGFLYSSILKPYSVINNKIIFSCLKNDAADGLMEPWVTDGTIGGTKQLADIFPGSVGSQSIDQYPGDNKIIMPSNDGDRGFEPWVTDGTTVSLLSDYNPGEASSFDYDLGFSALLAAADNPTTTSVFSLRKGKKVFGVASDGSSLREIFDDSDTSKNIGSEPRYFTKLGDKLVFRADDPNKLTEVYITDGTRRGTRLLKNIRKTEGSYPFGLVALERRGLVVFSSSTGDKGAEIWVTDGTRRGTKLLKDIYPGPQSSIDTIFAEVHRDKVYFVANDGSTGGELWVTNGKARGTKKVRDIRPGVDSSNPGAFVSFKGKGYFRANDGSSGSELWVLEGSNTRLLADIDPGAGSSSPIDFVKVKDKLFFTASTPANGRELWVTDGTTVSMVKDIYPGVDDAEIGRMTASGDYLFFVAEDGVHGEELWRSDGTEAGTVLVSDIYPGSSGSAITGLYPFRGGKVLFGARNAPNDTELWLGSVSGVSRIKDINPTGSSGPSAFIKIPGKRRFYFRATTAEHGNELWVTNGKEEGTRLVADINPGTDPSLISEMTIFGDALVFAADDGRRGREPWIIRNP